MKYSLASESLEPGDSTESTNTVPSYSTDVEMLAPDDAFVNIPTMATAIPTTGLADRALLDKIDKLFACHVGEYISLPQLVVVGDQSSGKSSVLEGLTELPFPRDSGLCTRFATQITFRRQTKKSISVSIIPDANAAKEHTDKARAWKKDGLESLTKETFSSIMKDAQQVMGLVEAQSQLPGLNSKKTFSKDVLKLEVSGPDQEHFSVIDIPGIFSRTTSGVTTKEDKKMVRDMVLGYMQSPRSVILAVIPANVDIATQEILEMAEEVDSHGQRTLGVLTKPDLVDKGAESAVIELLDGTRHRLNLGWHIVRNLGQADLGDPKVNRSARETSFFSNNVPWNDLDKDKTGVFHLKLRLREILAEMVRREFPNVKREMIKKLNESQQRLEELGSSREFRDDQYKYLLNLSVQFQGIASFALAAQYGNHPIFEKHPKLKLATAIVDRNTRFSDDLFKAGHSVKFLDDEHDDTTFAESKATPNNPKYPPLPLTRYEKDVEELDDILVGEEKTSTDVPFAAFATSSKSLGQANGSGQGNSTVSNVASFSNPSGPIMAWIEQVYTSSRGFELGSFDTGILPVLWKKQSTHWGRFGLGYISDIVSLVHNFFTNVLAALCSDERIRAGLVSVLIEQLTDRYKKARRHAKFLLEVERDGTPLTTNHYFTDNLEKCRQRRFKAMMEKRSNKLVGHGDVPYVRVDALNGISYKSNLEHTIQDIHDILKAYYKVARKRFVDSMCMQASDHYLVTGPNTPLKVFSPTFVSDLSDEQLETIAGEDVYTKRKRKQLKKEIADLQAGRKILV